VKKRQTVGLLLTTMASHAISQEVEQRWRAAQSRLRAEQLRALEGLMPLFEEAIVCAKAGKTMMVHRLEPEDMEKELADIEERIRRLKGD